MTAPPPGSHIGRYQVIRLLGHGGAGDVFLARDPQLERSVAIKLLHASEPRGLADEAKALAALDHPNIVTIHEIGEHEGREFIALEYLPGHSLRELLVQRAPRHDLVAVCAQVAHAVAAAHRANLLHGDIKPENIIVSDAGLVKVVDFGLASQVDEAERRTPRAITAQEQLRRTLPPASDTLVDAGVPTLWGTPSYMAPEILIGVPPTRASDVFSLGVVLYECLTGTRPNNATTVVEAIALLVDGPPPRIADPLGALVERMLAHDRAARPTLDAVGAQLEADGVPPPGPRRRRTWPWLIAGALLVASAASIAALALRPSPTAATTSATIVVRPPELQLTAYGAEPPDIAAYADVIATLLDDAAGARGIVGESPDATHVMATRFVQDGEQLRATLTVTDPAQRATTLSLSRPADQLAELIHDVVVATLHSAHPRATLAHSGTRRAQALYRAGKASMDRGEFTHARPALEQAVVEDPSLFDAWYGLTLTLAWMQAPEPRILAAARAAEAIAPAGSKRELVRGVALFVGGEFGAAREKLSAIELDRSASAPDQRDLLYYSGEANWHDGRHAAAFAYFQEVLKRDRAFGAAAVHAWQFAIASRNGDVASYYAALAHQSPEWTDFALGNYTKLLHSDDPAVKLSAQLATGTTASPEITARIAEDTFDAGTLRTALALAASDTATAEREVTKLLARAESATMLELESLGDVILAGELTASIAPLAAIFDARGTTTPSRRVRRFAILGAALQRDARIPDGVTDRERRLATAVTAERAGDRTAAAEQLSALLADPSVHGDHAERAALLRNLAPADRARVCDHALRPAVPRYAMIVVRARCAR